MEKKLSLRDYRAFSGMLGPKKSSEDETLPQEAVPQEDSFEDAAPEEASPISVFIEASEEALVLNFEYQRESGAARTGSVWIENRGSRPVFVLAQNNEGVPDCLADFLEGGTRISSAAGKRAFLFDGSKLFSPGAHPARHISEKKAP